MSDVTRAETCVIACAEIFSGAGEIMASPMATTPADRCPPRAHDHRTRPAHHRRRGADLRRHPAVGQSAPIEGWMPFRKVFDVVASGRRHVVMGANQIDRTATRTCRRFGRSSTRPARCSVCVGLPANTINHPTSYWVAKHSSRVFTDTVDIISVSATTTSTRQPCLPVPARPPRGHQPRCLRLRRPRPHVPRAVAAPGVTADEVAENTRVSRWPGSPRPVRPAIRPTRSCP